jgi:hypothetical protein
MIDSKPPAEAPMPTTGKVPRSGGAVDVEPLGVPKAAFFEVVRSPCGLSGISMLPGDLGVPGTSTL